MANKQLPKDMKKLVDQLLEIGWRREDTNRHVMLKSPKGGKILIHTSSVSRRGLYNAQADARRVVRAEMGPEVAMNIGR